MFEEELNKYTKIKINEVNKVASKYLTKPFVALSVVPMGKKNLKLNNYLENKMKKVLILLFVVFNF